MNTIELLIDPPAIGAWNMAVDEMLLERAAERGTATLRFYEWSPATLSLGYFQRAAERESHTASRLCPLVRRASGGGAIVHDRELTYSLALPTAHPLAADAETLYYEVHRLLIAALAEFGVSATLSEKRNVSRREEPFLCFQRRSGGDIVVGPHKICGSAQRRNKGAILQHGSVLVAASPAAPELPGLAELGAPAINVAALTEAWLGHWRAQLRRRALSLSAADVRGLDETETGRADEIRVNKYAAPVWTNRR
jgi:lipoate-protein ligase A